MSEFEVVGLVKSESLKFNRAGAKKIRTHLKKIGWQFGWLLFWQQLVQGFAYLINLIIPYQKDRLMPAWSLAKHHYIPVFKCRNVNEEETIEFIKSKQPDLIISAYFNQILKTEIINLPKLGILNVHPGWLPIYRGAMTYFWVLRNNSESAGVSIHWIDEGIDTGALVARRSFVIKSGMTQQRILSITATIGAKLLKRLGKKLQEGEKLEVINTNTNEDTYYPMPGSDDFNEYFKQRRFFRIRDLMSTILRVKS